MTNKLSILKLLILLLVFFIPLDLEFTVGAISGEGERLGNASVLEGDVYVVKNSLGVGLKISDLLALAIFILIILKIGYTFFLKNKNISLVLDIRFYFSILLFFLVSSSVLALNINELTQPQLTASFAYLAKLAEISLFYIFFVYYLNAGYNPRSIYKTLVLSATIAGIVGIINPFTGWFTGWFIPDRVEYYGVLTIVCITLTALLLSTIPVKSVTGYSRTAIWIVVVLLGVSVLLCGKRTVGMGLIIGMIILFLKMFSARNFVKISLIAMLVLIFSGASLVEQLVRTVGDNYYVGEGLSDRYKTAIIGSVFDGIYGLDLSTAERLGKLLLGVNYYFDHPFFGVGFWSAQYVYNFLPDSIFQVLLEVGIIGIMLLAYPIFSLFRQARKPNLITNYSRFIAIAWKVATITIILMGFAANIAYSYKVVAVFLLITALLRHHLLMISVQSKSLN